jgi:hypothetical protein
LLFLRIVFFFLSSSFSPFIFLFLLFLLLYFSWATDRLWVLADTLALALCADSAAETTGISHIENVGFSGLLVRSNSRRSPPEVPTTAVMENPSKLHSCAQVTSSTSRRRKQRISRNFPSSSPHRSTYPKRTQQKQQQNRKEERRRRRKGEMNKKWSGNENDGWGRRTGGRLT